MRAGRAVDLISGPPLERTKSARSRFTHLAAFLQIPTSVYWLLFFR